MPICVQVPRGICDIIGVFLKTRNSFVLYLGIRNLLGRHFPEQSVVVSFEGREVEFSTTPCTAVPGLAQ